MRRLIRELRQTLGELELIEPVQLGKPLRRQASEADTAKLDAMLARQRSFNDRLVIAAVCMVVGIFLLSVSMTLYGRDNPMMLSVAFGGNVFSILVTVGWIRRLWIEKSYLDLASIAIEQLPPEAALQLAASLYWHLLSAQAKGGLPRKSQPDEAAS